jgi:sugar phosphate isomerase/epimerase
MRDLSGRLDLCSINTATLGHHLPIGDAIDTIARAGFGAICPWRRDVDGKDAVAVGRHIRDAGLSVSGYCRSTYLPAADRAQFSAAVDDNRRAIDQAAELGAACFVIVSGSLPPGSRDLSAARSAVEEGTAILLEHARGAGVRLALEPLHPRYAGDRCCINTLAQAIDLVARVEPAADAAPMLGLALDVYHLWWDPDLAEGVARAGAMRRIFAFHVCDWLVPTGDLVTDRGMMGDGVIDIRGIRRLVEDAGYAGSVEVEIFSAENWWKRPAGEVLAQCAARLQEVC